MSCIALSERKFACGVYLEVDNLNLLKVDIYVIGELRRLIKAVRRRSPYFFFLGFYIVVFAYLVLFGEALRDVSK